IANFKSMHRLCGEFLHLLQGHLFVGFVVKIERSTSSRIVSDYSVKNDGSAVLRLFQPFQYGLLVDTLPNDLRMRSTRGSTTHPRQQSDLVICRQAGVRPGVLLVHRKGNGRKELFQTRDSVLVVG